MLYSSAREDLKRNLGAGYFKTEYAANYRADLTWQNYLLSLHKGFDIELLTETERLVLEEKVNDHFHFFAAWNNIFIDTSVTIITNRL